MPDLTYASFMPTDIIELAGIAIGIVVVAMALIVLWRYRTKNIPSALLKDSSALQTAGKIRIFLRFLVVEAVLNSNLYQKSKSRWFVHIMVFWGFIGLGITTMMVMLLYPGGMVRPFFSFVKILGNTSGVAVMIGGIIALVKRWTDPQPSGKTSYDLVFLPLLVLTVVTGFVAQYARLAGFDSSMLAVYGIHLLFTILLIVLAPFTQFIHALTTPYLALFDRYRMALVAKGYARDPHEERILADAKAKFYSELSVPHQGDLR